MGHAHGHTDSLCTFPGWVAIVAYIDRKYRCVTTNDRARMYQEAADLFTLQCHKDTFSWENPVAQRRAIGRRQGVRRSQAGARAKNGCPTVHRHGNRSRGRDWHRARHE